MECIGWISMSMGPARCWNYENRRAPWSSEPINSTILVHLLPCSIHRAIMGYLIRYKEWEIRSMLLMYHERLQKICRPSDRETSTHRILRHQNNRSHSLYIVEAKRGLLHTDRRKPVRQVVVLPRCTFHIIDHLLCVGFHRADFLYTRSSIRFISSKRTL